MGDLRPSHLAGEQFFKLAVVFQTNAGSPITLRFAFAFGRK